MIFLDCYILMYFVVFYRSGERGTECSMEKVTKVLVVEDEIDLSDGLKLFIENAGFEVKQAFNGKEAKEAFYSFMPNIILLDILLPDIRGDELCELFRLDPNVGIIFLTALNDRSNLLNGFDLGADDYVTKPFDIEILLSRIHALNKRLNISNDSTTKTSSKEQIGRLIFDFYNNDVIYNSKRAYLTLTEFKIIHCLALNQEKYCSSHELLSNLSNIKNIKPLNSRTISVHISKIRQKLQSIDMYKEIIETKYRVGYKYIEEISQLF